MGAKSGVTFLLKVKDDDTAETLRTVGGGRGATLNRKVETIDTTSKSSAGWRERITSFRDWSIDFDGLYFDDDLGQERLLDAFLNKEIITVQILEDNGDKWDGDAILEDFPLEMPHEDAAMISGTLTGTGALVRTPA